MSSITVAKAALRKEVKQRIAAISPDEKCRQSNLIYKKILENNFYKRSKRLCFYLNMPDEVSTMDIMKHALLSGKECFVPRYTKTEMQMLRLFSYEDYDGLPLTKWNIKQPEIHEAREEALSSGGLDLILVPGLAFTIHGHRLGRGKGYYDEYLKKCKETSNPTISIGLSFNEQIVDKIPVEEHDIHVHHVFHP